MPEQTVQAVEILTKTEQNDRTVIEATITENGETSKSTFVIMDSNPNVVICADDQGEDEMSVDELRQMNKLFNAIIEVADTKLTDDVFEDDDWKL